MNIPNLASRHHWMWRSWSRGSCERVVASADTARGENPVIDAPPAAANRLFRCSRLEMVMMPLSLPGKNSVNARFSIDLRQGLKHVVCVVVKLRAQLFRDLDLLVCLDLASQ